jgi:hypothetical protein
MQELQRTLISQPMSTTPLIGYTPPKPRDAQGNRIQVTAYSDEYGRTVERWDLSETDVRWYHVEKYVRKRVTVTTERRAPLE